MLSAGITNAPSGATIMKSRITANCRKASAATTNVWYGVKGLADFLSEGGMQDRGVRLIDMSAWMRTLVACDRLASRTSKRSR